MEKNPPSWGLMLSGGITSLDAKRWKKPSCSQTTVTRYQLGGCRRRTEQRECPKSTLGFPKKWKIKEIWEGRVLSQPCNSPRVPPAGVPTAPAPGPAAPGAAAASPALFSKLFPWPRLTPALGLSCSLLSSFSPEKSRDRGDAEVAELIYATGSPAPLHMSPGSDFGDSHIRNSSPDNARAIISPPFPSHQEQQAS